MRALRKALTRIVTTDATIQSLCGRATHLIVPWRGLVTAQLPVVAYLFPSSEQTAQSGEKWEIGTQLSCFADEATGGLATVEDMIERLRAIIKNPTFAALVPPYGPLDATIMGLDRARDVPDVPTQTVQQGRFRKDLELTIRVTLS